MVQALLRSLKPRASLLVAGIIASSTACGNTDGPALISAPDPSGGGRISLGTATFGSDPESVCVALGQAVVPDVRRTPIASRTTANQQVHSTKVVTGHVPVQWAELPPRQALVRCSWTSDNAEYLTGLYVVRRGVGLRNTGTYIGTAVIDQTGRWAADETVFFDAYD